MENEIKCFYYLREVRKEMKDFRGEKKIVLSLVECGMFVIMRLV